MAPVSQRLGRRGAAVGAGLGTGVLGLGLGLGWFYSSLLLDTRRAQVFPELVLAADTSTVTLRRSRLTAQPGVWGLRWADGLARVGPILAGTRAEVVRRRDGGPIPPPGTPAVIDAGPFDPDPSARGLRFIEVDVRTPLGAAPAWFVPAAGPDWVVLVHGRGGARRESLRVLSALHTAGYPTLTITYRNDEGAPRSPDGLHHLGDTEWEDLQSAVLLATARGARRVALFGWSMGAAVIGAFLDRSPDAARVAAVVWDAPLVDWRATLRRQARNRRLPGRLAAVACVLTSRRIGIDFDRFDLRAHPPAVRPPTLLLHSDIDTAVPAGPSRALAAAAPALDWPMRYVEVPGVEHTGSWNADPERYERLVAGFLAEHLGTDGAAPDLARWGP
ncbi:MAG: alpha/beta hydrolase family protein [Pseudonocardia sp.]